MKGRRGRGTSWVCRKHAPKRDKDGLSSRIVGLSVDRPTWQFLSIGEDGISRYTDRGDDLFPDDKDDEDHKRLADGDDGNSIQSEKTLQSIDTLGSRSSSSGSNPNTEHDSDTDGDENRVPKSQSLPKLAPRSKHNSLATSRHNSDRPHSEYQIRPWSMHLASDIYEQLSVFTRQDKRHGVDKTWCRSKFRSSCGPWYGFNYSRCGCRLHVNGEGEEQCLYNDEMINRVSVWSSGEESDMQYFFPPSHYSLVLPTRQSSTP